MDKLHKEIKNNEKNLITQLELLEQCNTKQSDNNKILNKILKIHNDTIKKVDKLNKIVDNKI
jgi:hypothetical protein